MKDKRSTGNLFLLELIIVICFFAIAGAIVMQVFLKADELSARSAEQNGAMMLAQGTLETVRSKPLDQLKEGTETRYYDEEWQETDAAKAAYELTLNVKLTPKPAGTMLSADCTIAKSEKLAVSQTAGSKSSAKKGEVYSLGDKKYFKNEGKHL